MVTNIPELGVVSTQQEDWLCYNNGQRQKSSLSSSHQPPFDTDDGGVHVYVHAEDDYGKRDDDSEEEVMLFDKFVYDKA